MDGGSLSDLTKRRGPVPERYLAEIARQVGWPTHVHHTIYTCMRCMSGSRPDLTRRLSPAALGLQPLTLWHRPPPSPHLILSLPSPQVLCGLQYLHKDLHVVHRDVKPSNLLLNTRGEVRKRGGVGVWKGDSFLEPSDMLMDHVAR